MESRVTPKVRRKHGGSMAEEEKRHMYYVKESKGRKIHLYREIFRKVAFPYLKCNCELGLDVFLLAFDLINKMA